MDKPIKAYYAIIPANVRYDVDLKPNAKLLYGEITALCNERGYCWASNAYFAELYNSAPETISRWISALQEKNYIQIVVDQQAGNKRKIYMTGVLPLLTEKSIPTDKKDNTPIDEIINTPIDEKVKHNNTDINTTSINNKNNEKAELEKFCNDVIENFISVTGKKIKLNDHRKKLILARKKEGYGLEDFKEVIRKKNKEWKGNSQMDKHLTPDTLFSPSKFTKYVEQDEPKEGSNNNTSSKAGPTAIIPKGKRFGY